MINKATAANETTSTATAPQKGLDEKKKKQTTENHRSMLVTPLQRITVQILLRTSVML